MGRFAYHQRGTARQHRPATSFVCDRYALKSCLNIIRTLTAARAGPKKRKAAEGPAADEHEAAESAKKCK